MRRNKLLPIAVLLASAVGAIAAPVRLEVRLEAGQSHRFRVVDETALSATLPGGGERKSNTRTTATFDLLVDRVNPDGTYTVRVRPGAQTVVANDRETTVDPLPEATANLSRQGRISRITGPERSSGDSGSGYAARDFLEFLFDEEAGYPSNPVEIGGAWKYQVESPLDERAGRITINNTLLAVDELDGKQVARVLNIVAEPVQVPADEDGVTMAGTLEGGGLANVDLATGLPLEGRDTVRLRFTVSAPRPDGTGSMDVATEATIKVRLHAVEPDPA